MIKTLFLTLGLLFAGTSEAHEPCREALRPIGGYYTPYGWEPVRWVPTGHCHTTSYRPVTHTHTHYRPHTHYVPPRPRRPILHITIRPRPRPSPRPRPRPHRH